MDCSACTDVHEAVAKGCVKCLERIIGPDNYQNAANQEDSHGLTPLIRAVLLKQPSDVIKSLVKLGADVNKEGFNQEGNQTGSKIASNTPLSFAVEQDKLEAVKALHEAAPSKRCLKKVESN